ncbi:MAG: cupin domain-containing protein [Pyrinomonadaceae bacterium]|nr:cupin domain-containing protein [Blastocatellia bacterium]MCW5955452.1 cupin domain-containing protein [Pyrinomonadaceae bacterium]
MRFYDLNKLDGDAVNPRYSRKAVYGDSVSVAKLEVMKGEVTQPHSHNTEEMIFVLKGAWLFHLPDVDVLVEDNQILSIPAGVMHSSEVIEDTIAIDICSNHRTDWRSGQDRILHTNPEQFLWAV